MSGNAALDQQIAQAMVPRYNPMQGMQQRQPVQQVQNPVFGGAIPMQFGMQQQSQPSWMTQQSAPAWMPQAQYSSPLSRFRPASPSFYLPPPPVAINTPETYRQEVVNTLGYNPHGSSDGSTYAGPFQIPTGDVGDLGAYYVSTMGYNPLTASGTSSGGGE